MKWNAIRLSAITTAILFGWLRLQGEGLITATSPLGIVDLELADTPSRLSALLLAWNKAIAVNNILIDFLFIPSYALFLSLGCRQLAMGYRQSVLVTIGNFMAKGVWLAAFLDVIENLLMLGSIHGYYSSSSLELTRWVAIIKFSLVAIAVLFLVICSIHYPFKKKPHGT
ncbi:MAG: hypothetical protein IM541_07930 [Chitinophagaceae bacterium]|nr:hypothetical protein [Chitinophagaceae bacterium]